MDFTKEQQQAIDTSGRDLLVSAAAGSGKTAVLVERIIQRVLDKDNPADIDRMLVMTFTKAAADQMREKILKAIEKEKKNRPFDKHLQKQASLVHNAQITTIHGFCMNILRNHFASIDLNPDFRVGDTGEMKLLEQDTLKKLLEEEYASDRESFITMSESLATGKSDKTIEEIVLKLYSYAMSYPMPEKWLDECCEPYLNADSDTFAKGNQAICMHRYISRTINAVLEELYSIKKICEKPNGPAMYINTLEADIQLVEGLSEAEDYMKLWEFFYPAPPRFVTLGTGSKKKDGAGVDEALKIQVKEKRDACKKTIQGLFKYFSLSPETALDNMRKSYENVAEIVSLTREFIERFNEVKRENNICDFSDLEHLSLRVLGLDEASSVSLEYRNYFREIFIDEYQDSNSVQELLLDRVSNGHNLFMVGDVKQSIYRFRLAKPDLFLEKYDTFAHINSLSCQNDFTSSGDKTSTKVEASTGGETSRNNLTCPCGNGIRIDLNHNFRSRASVLDSVNEVFEKIMTQESGSIEYDEAARLKVGASDYPTITSDIYNDRTELILIKKDEEVSDRELEARVITDKINSIIGHYEVYDRDKQEMRPAIYSDIAILLRANKGWDDVFKRILLDAGIPVQVESQSGYFDAYEVSLLLDLMRVVDNPMQDIPLMAVLVSPFAGMSEKEIALLKANSRKLCKNSGKKDLGLYGSLMTNLEVYHSADSELTKDIMDIMPKVDKFIIYLNGLRHKVGYTPVYDILREIIDGFYGNYVSSLMAGDRRRANLDMLLKKAIDYGKTSYKGLFHFVRYIDAIKKYEVDFGEANVLDEHDNTVRIMSIHKSKGLEFPICFVAGMHKQYNYMDANSKIVLDSDLGIGIDYIDLNRRTRMNTLAKHVIAEKIVRESFEEEMRVLYVAMTRAKEKLIMTAMVKEPENVKSSGILLKCKSYLDLIKYAESKGSFSTIDEDSVDVHDLIDIEVENNVRRDEAYEELKKILSHNGDKSIKAFEVDGNIISLSEEDKTPDININNMRNLTYMSDFSSDFMKTIGERLSFTYIPPKATVDNYPKISVSELKRRSMDSSLDEDKDIPKEEIELFDHNKQQSLAKEKELPSFMKSENETVSPALHGTAVHRIFELWEYEREISKESVVEFLNETLNSGRAEADLVKSVKVGEILAFLKSDIASRMKDAYLRDGLHREQPFVIEMDEYLIQGIIDAYFIEAGKIVVVDYKTDKVMQADELIERYHVQLEYYGRALSRLLDMPVKELVIYSTVLAKSITMGIEK